ncbi:MAG: hypothetical protein HY905_18405 [Deltaproteobacteria bacterium]|nr:hypothetical protein [Deltaproteobacteria bacterium]
MRSQRRWWGFLAAVAAAAALAGCPATDDDTDFDVRDVPDDGGGDVPAEDAADDGAAEVPECPAGQTWCGTGCRDLLADPEHCGTCDTACGALDVCDRGTCAPGCSGGRLNCGRSCVDAQTDPEHCGTCDTVCPAAANADPACETGACGLECLDGYVDLDALPGCEYACEVAGAEACNAVDDDCDAETDEDFACLAGEPVACTTACGSAGSGTCSAECAVPAPDACPLPAEACNGEDDDCDTRCDNGFTCCAGDTAPCLTTCSSIGARTCDADCAWGECLPAAEECNGLDDDCDTVTDSGFECTRRATETCTTACGSAGNRACGDDCAWGVCTPPRELCNGTDDDCDTVIDNGFACTRGATEACDSGCATGGSRTCSATCTWGSCQPPLEACNAADDDCDTATDETFACALGSTRSCTNSCGVSVSQTCGAACTFPAACCAAAEVCGNSCDDDCDGSTNEDCTRGDTCADAIVIAPGTTTISGDTSTMAADYGGVCVTAPGPEMVYRFTPTTTVTVTFSTCGGAAYDTVLYAWAGTCGSGSTVACADDSCGVQSTITFTALAGTTYYVVMDGYGTASLGPFTLTVTGL